MTWRPSPTQAVVAAVLLLTACGDDTPASPDREDPASPAGTAAGLEPADQCPDHVEFEGRVSDRGAAPVSPDGATIEAVDFEFVPTCLLVPEGGQVLTVTVDNTGDALHNITVEDQGIDEDVTSGERVTVDIEVPDDGTVTFVCKYHTASGMVGAVTVPQS